MFFIRWIKVLVRWLMPIEVSAEVIEAIRTAKQAKLDAIVADELHQEKEVEEQAAMDAERKALEDAKTAHETAANELAHALDAVMTELKIPDPLPPVV